MDSICEPGCPFCCRGSMVYLFHSHEVHTLRHFANKLKVMDKFIHRAESMNKCDDVEEVLALNLVCPFLDTETNLCRIYSQRPEACANWISDNIHLCDSGKRHCSDKEHVELAVKNNARLQLEFDMVEEMGFAITGIPNCLEKEFEFIEYRRKMEVRNADSTNK